MGEAPVEEAQRRHGALRVEGVTFTAAAKQHMATLAKQALEERRLRIPAGDAALRAELHSLRRVITPAGNVRFDARGAKTAAQAGKTAAQAGKMDGHADRRLGGVSGHLRRRNAGGRVCVPACAARGRASRGSRAATRRRAAAAAGAGYRRLSAGAVVRRRAALLKFFSLGGGGRGLPV